MSLLNYNGVTLPYVRITDFSQSALRDESETDWYLTKFDIAAEAVINTDYITTICPDMLDKTTNVADVMTIIRTRLLAHRKRLSIVFNGTDLVPAKQTGITGDVDAMNGPRPMSCDITQLTNTTFFIRYRIVAHYWESHDESPNVPVPNNPGNNVLYNRWSESQEIDGRGFSRRVREGKFVIRSDNRAGQIADTFRSQMAVVGVPTGFLRESSSYTVDPSGLGLAYRIVDQEVFKQPPNPAFEAVGSYTESFARGGASRFGEVRVNLKAAKGVFQRVLLDVAVAVASSKIGANGAVAVFENSSVTVNMYDNEVSVHLLARFLKENEIKKRFYNIAGNRFGDPMVFTPLSDVKNKANRPKPEYLDRGSANLLLQAAAYYDPALRNTQLNPTTGQLNQGTEPGKGGRAP